MRKKAGRSTDLVRDAEPPLPPGQLIYECGFGADSSVTSEVKNAVLDELLDALRKSGAIADEGDEIRTRLCLDEALVNAVMHGSKYNPEKTVTVRAYQSDAKYSVLIEDEGEGFREEDLPDPGAAENLLEESGRGVHLIRSIMDEVGYWRGGRVLLMSRILKGKGPRRSSTRKSTGT